MYPLASLQLVTPPTDEVVPIDELKEYLRIVDDGQDRTLLRSLRAAVDYCQTVTRRQFAKARYRMQIERFPGGYWDGSNVNAGGSAILVNEPGSVLGLNPVMTAVDRLAIDVFLPPLNNVVSISYVDGNGATQTVDPATYQVDKLSEPGRILPIYGTIWPFARRQPAAVTVLFDAGYATPDLIPDGIVQAVLWLACHYFENRGEQLESKSIESVDRLLAANGWGSFS